MDRLQVLSKELKQAFESRDWDRLAQLDDQLRLELENAVKSVVDNDPVFVSLLKRYQRIYELMIRGAEKHRDEIISELKKVTKENKAANVYLQSSAYRG